VVVIAVCTPYVPGAPRDGPRTIGVPANMPEPDGPSLPKSGQAVCGRAGKPLGLDVPPRTKWRSGVISRTEMFIHGNEG
jgi:hypothetical protein